MPLPLERGSGPSPWGDRYPLVAPSADVRGLLADAWVWHARAAAVLPLRIARLVGFGLPEGSFSSEPGESSIGGANPAQVLIVDADGVGVFDSERDAERYSKRAWSSRFTVHEWVGPRALCRLVQRTTTEGIEGGWPHVLEPESAVLDERCSVLRPARLDALVVGGRRLSGVVRVVGGYNARSSANQPVTPTSGLVRASTRRSRTPVRLDLSPGLGEGAYQDCGPETPAVRRIAGVSPDAAGNLRLLGDGCYWVRRPAPLTLADPRTVSLTPGELELGNDCGPCCTCEDYQAVWDAQAAMAVRYREIGRRAEAARDQLAANKARWEAQRECREGLSVRLLLVSATEDTVTVLAAVCNGRQACGPVELQLEVTDLVGGGYFVPNGTFVTDPATRDYRPGTLTGTTDSANYVWPTVDAGQTVKVRTTVRFDPHPDGCGNTAAVVARAVDPATGVVQRTAEKSVALNCEPGAGAMTVA